MRYSEPGPSRAGCKSNALSGRAAERQRQATSSPAMAREQINRGRLRAQIAVQETGPDCVCIFCPAEVSGRLYQHLLSHGLSSEAPRGAMFGHYSQDELIVTSSYESVQEKIDAFVGSLPEICYERDQA